MDTKTGVLASVFAGIAAAAAAMMLIARRRKRPPAD